ncbi:hypothetical protein M2163_009189 [Streptomyces sp. SAI-135]|nr:hypothetical protein [Streptomyces sp. SAI-090]MDH6546007.1 hypothetical protein [Streptomyces sp. SAI-041]MDH6565096.1 hypothetical protein [Streptomyces sp. SAI-117]MDH6622081.1 hypothetical protein [Streptomyces sp. SAI-135]
MLSEENIARLVGADFDAGEHVNALCLFPRLTWTPLSRQRAQSSIDLIERNRT